MNLAYKYADAFINVYNSRLNLDDVERINQAMYFLKEHPRALFLLQVPVIKHIVKEKVITDFCRRFGLIEPMRKMIILLLNHKRAYLLITVLQAIVDRYQKYHTIEKITVKSSIALPEKYRHDIEQFVNRHISGIKKYHYEIDATLIAGIRIQSDTMLWEYSINKHLRDIAHTNS